MDPPTNQLRPGDSIVQLGIGGMPRHPLPLEKYKNDNISNNCTTTICICFLHLFLSLTNAPFLETTVLAIDVTGPQ